MPSNTEIVESRDEWKERRKDQKFPKISYVFLVLEILHETLVMCEVTILTQPHYHNNTVTKSDLEGQIGVMLVAGGTLAVFGSAIADGYTGTFRIFYTFYIFACIRPLLVLLISSNSIDHEMKEILFQIVNFLYFGMMFLNPIRIAIVLQQMSAPTQINNMRRYIALYIIANGIGDIISTVLSEEMIKNTGPINLYCVLLIFMYMCYILAFTLMKPYLQPQMVVPHVTEKLVSSIFIGSCRAIKALMTNRNDHRNHWLDRLEIDFDDHYIYNAKVFCGLLKFFFPLLAAFCAHGFLTLLIADQIKRMAPSVIYSFLSFNGLHGLLNVVVLTIFELFIIRILTCYNIRWSSLKFLGICYIFYALTLAVGLAIHIAISRGATFLPDRGFGQIRFYNAHVNSAFLESNLFILANPNDSSVDLPAFSVYVVARAITDGRRSAEVHVKLSDSNRIVDFIEEVIIIENESISYVITPRGITRVIDFDPLVRGPPGMDDPKLPRAYILCGLPFCNGDLILKNKLSLNQVSLPRSANKNQVFTVVANSYNISIRIGEISIPLIRNLQLEVGGVYAILIHPFREVIGGTVYTVVKPGIVSQIYILPEAILFAISTTLLYIASIEFLYFNSPPKLLSTTIAFFYTHDGFALAIVFCDYSLLHPLFTYDQIIFYLITLIVMTVLHFYVSSHFKGQTWTLEGVLYDKYQPDVTTYPKFAVLPFTKRASPEIVFTN